MFMEDTEYICKTTSLYLYFIVGNVFFLNWKIKYIISYSILDPFEYLQNSLN